MSTPKPGQIRCPNCHRPTPPAAFCTQCGAAIPSSLQARPRGMDRDELDERIRTRRPGEGGVRRGTPFEDSQHDSRPAGYVPFAPEPEDAMAVREPDAEAPVVRVDNTSPDFDWPQQDAPSAPQHVAPGAEAWQPAGEPAAVVPDPPRGDFDSSVEARAPVDEPYATDPRYGEAQPYEADGRYDAEGPYDQEVPYDPEGPYDGQEEAYPYPYLPAAADGRRRGGSSALPIIGFILLCALALGVGAVLAGFLGGNGGVGDASPTPSAGVSAAASVEPSVEPSTAPSDEASATPEPTDGPVTFPDGALIEVQACATQEMSFDGCDVDGSVITEPTMWVWIGFDDAQGSDTFVLTLRSDGQTVDQQEKVLGDVLDCPGSCSGYLIGAAYRDLEPGEYELVVRRNDDFADSASFSVEG